MRLRTLVAAMCGLCLAAPRTASFSTRDRLREDHDADQMGLVEAVQEMHLLTDQLETLVTGHEALRDTENKELEMHVCEARSDRLRAIMAQCLPGMAGVTREGLGAQPLDCYQGLNAVMKAAVRISAILPATSPFCQQVLEKPVLHQNASVLAVDKEDSDSRSIADAKLTLQSSRELSERRVEHADTDVARRLLDVPRLCHVEGGPCAPWRAGWGGNRWQADAKAIYSSERRLDELSSPGGRFEPVKLAVELSGKLFPAVTYGARALSQRTLRDTPISGFAFDNVLVLADSYRLCSPASEQGSVACGVLGTNEVTYPTVSAADESESQLYMQSLGL